MVAVGNELDAEVGEPVLVEPVARRLLAPLNGMTAKQRDRVLETLRAWLDTQGSVLDMATRLGVPLGTVKARVWRGMRLLATIVVADVSEEGGPK